MMEVVYPILTRLGPFFVYSYTAVFAVGLLLSWVITQRQAGQKSLAGWPDAAFATLLPGWLGARVSFVFLNWSYFAERPSELFQLWQGGLTAFGGLVGGLLGLRLWCWWRKRPFLSYAALFSPAFLLLIVTGWAACWVEGCAYGTVTTLGPLAADLPDHFGVFAVRYQTQLLGIGLNLLALVFVQYWQERWGNGRLFSIMLILASLIHFGLTFLRGDAVPTLVGWRLDSWLALLFAILALFLLQYGRYLNSRRESE
jgi:phosphatidylglycerol:prolipoprotein diacylglycerol transferase